MSKEDQYDTAIDRAITHLGYASHCFDNAENADEFINDAREAINEALGLLALDDRRLHFLSNRFLKGKGVMIL